MSSDSDSGCGFFVIALVVAVIGFGYLYQEEGGKIFGPDGVVETINNPPKTPRVPRPSSEGFIDWLAGHEIRLVEGVFFDDYWLIEPGEVSNFTVKTVLRDSETGNYTATVSFRATAKGSGIIVEEAIIRYKDSSEDDDLLTFIDFVAVSVREIGQRPQ